MRRFVQSIGRVIVALSTFLVACNREQAPDCMQSAGEVRGVQRELDSFESIELRDYLQFELKDTTWYGVELFGPVNLLPEINAVVENGRLTITNENTCNFMRSYKHRITVRICAPDFADIQNYATGDIRSINRLDGEKFSIDNRSAAGIQTFELSVDTANIASHTGVSDTYVTGTTDVVYLFSQGLGIVNAEGLSANYAFVNNSSLNDVHVRSSNYLFAYLQFSGNIYYLGNPQFIDRDIEGTGLLIAQ